MVAFLLKSSVIDRLQHPVHHLVTSRTAVEKRSGDFYGRSRALGHRSWLPQVEAKQLAQLRYPNHRIGWRPNGRFPKCGYPQNHSFLGIFHDKASTLGIPHLCKPSNLCFPPWVWNLDPYTYYAIHVQAFVTTWQYVLQGAIDVENAQKTCSDFRSIWAVLFSQKYTS